MSGKGKAPGRWHGEGAKRERSDARAAIVSREGSRGKAAVCAAVALGACMVAVAYSAMVGLATGEWGALALSGAAAAALGGFLAWEEGEI